MGIVKRTAIDPGIGFRPVKWWRRALGNVVLLALLGSLLLASGTSSDPTASGGAPYPGMPEIAPIGARIANYMEVPPWARGPAVDPAEGYRLQDLGKGLYMITDNIYQSMS